MIDLLDFDAVTPRRVFWVFLLVAVVALLVAASTSTTDFSRYNIAWSGGSDLYAEAESRSSNTHVIRDTGGYANFASNSTLAVILSPDVAYSSSEQQDVRQFVRNGGTLLIAEDFGNQTNSLLRGIGSSARIDGRPLRDERYYYLSPELPVAHDVTAHPQVAGVEELVLNRGTAIVSRDATVLVNTSVYAYLDGNQNGELDAHESIDSYPVVTTEEIGSGRIIVVGDPSLFINRMLERPGNRAFLRQLVLNRQRIVFDYSHVESVPPVARAVVTVRRSNVLQFLLGSSVLGAVAFWLHWPRFRSWLLRRIGTDTEGPTSQLDGRDVVTYLERKHPDWDRQRIERVVRALEKRRRR